MIENTDTEVSVEEVDRVNDILLAMEQLKHHRQQFLERLKTKKE